jgi:purine nucleoside phosphorylase
MTNAPEIELAKVQGLCYGAVSLITNYCMGLSLTKRLAR